MCANRKLHSSKLFRRSGPTYTPYHLMAESRPPNLLICLIRSPLRLQRRYQAHPLLTGTSNIVYICGPIANYTVASSLNDRDQPTHHTNMMVESRPLYLLIRLIRSPLRLQQRYQAHPLLTGTSNVIYICGPIANYTVATSLNDWSLPTHHTLSLIHI